MPHLQQDSRLLLEAVVLSMQEMIEKPQLQLAPVVRVEVRPVLDAMNFEPLLLRGNPGAVCRGGAARGVTRVVTVAEVG